MNREAQLRREEGSATVVRLPGVEYRLTTERALRAAIDNQVFAALRELESLDGGRAVQAVYIALLRRLPNVTPDRKRLAVDSGFSESSIKRAIKLLEECHLITAERVRGARSTYLVADIRSVEVASDCTAAIRKRARAGARRSGEQGRVTCDPSSRASSGPGGRVTCEREVGSLVTHKGTSKNQSKKQHDVCQHEHDALGNVLERWGLLSASYLVKHGHKQAIPVLTEHPEWAAELIDSTMKKVIWAADAGTGARIAFLRQNIGQVFSARKELETRASRQADSAWRRIQTLVASLPVVPIPENIEATRASSLIERGFARLDVPEDVSRLIHADNELRARLLGHELLRESLEGTLARMSDLEFQETYERLRVDQPALRAVYPQMDRQSVGLRLCLVEHLVRKQQQLQGHTGTTAFPSMTRARLSLGPPSERASAANVR